MCSSQEDESTSSSALQTQPAKGVSDQLYEAYLKQRRYLIDAEREAAKSYDRWLLTLSGGALALSMTFIKDVVSPNGVDGPGWLLAAWLTLGGAVALGLVCIYVSQKAHEEFRGYLDDTLEEFQAKSDHAGFWAAVRTKEEKSRYAWWVGKLNFLSGAAFVVGITLLSYFACMNVPQRSSKPMPENENESTERAAPVEPDTQQEPQKSQESQETADKAERSPYRRIIAGGDRPRESSEPAMKPAPGPIDQAPAPKSEEPAEDK